jgi:Dyp-type peroxidase family
MAVDLTKAAQQVDLTAPQYAALLDNLQANIIWSHGRDHARHLFIRFNGTADAARTWIRTKVAPRVTSAKQQREQAAAKKADPAHDGGLVTGFYLSAAGYAFLERDPTKFADKGFRKGMKDRRDFDGPLILKFKNRDPEPAAWEQGFRGDIHALVTLADDKVGDNITRLLNTVEQVKGELAGVGTVTHVQDGRALRRPIPEQPGRFEPVEHFGYFDGISQPLFSKAELAKYDSDQGHPREPDEWDPGASLDLLLAADPFATAPDCFGSFLVYRKLEQDYSAFETRVKALASAIPANAELAGAYVVGRFKDGTPVSERDTSSPGTDVGNTFMHEHDDEDKDDSEGFRCPRAAHIRKANPRGTTPATSLKEERARRIVRRGIPYGKPHPDIGCDPAEFESQAGGPRGLVFMCFQASIAAHFEFIQRVWIDNKDFPKGVLSPNDTGDDPLIGQDPGEPQKWPRKWNHPPSGRRPFNFEAAVTLKGGEYFFAPSRPFLASA